MTAARTLVLAFALMTSPCAAVAADAPLSNERRLAPEEIEKILSEAERRRAGAGTAALMAEQAPESPGSPIHGEVGFAVGTGGYRAAHGTAVVGLPGEGVAIISLGTRRLPSGSHFYPDW